MHNSALILSKQQNAGICAKNWHIFEVTLLYLINKREFLDKI